jgi:hypothetical protein
VYATDFCDPVEPLTAEVPVAVLRDPGADLTPYVTAHRAEVYRQRHARRQPLRVEADAVRLVDYIRHLTRLGEMLWEDALAERGLRGCVKGIHKADNGRWRVRPWCPNTQRHVSIVDGYRNTRGEAKARLVEWWKVERNLDISYDPPQWLVDAIYTAHADLAKLPEAAGLKWDLEPDWEDDGAG